MGVPVSVDLRAGGDAAAVERAFAVLRRADERFSPFRPDSEVRRHGSEPGPVSADLADVLRIAQHAERISGGAFTVRAPDGTLDTNGVVKGWAAQRAADVLVAAGGTSFCLNAGGDVVTRGEPEPGRPWRTGVRDPADPGRVVAVVELRDGAVATSGTYERGEHVWDGRTGRPARGLAAATVVAADLTTADVLATCVLALGEEGVAWALAHGAWAAFGVRPDGTVLSGGASGDVPGPGPAAAA